MGFAREARVGEDTDAINRTFTPEFRNRLDAIVQFAPLGEESIGKVVDKFLFELEQQLAEKNVSLTVEQEVREWFAKEGYDPKMGARPMARLIQDEIKRPLSEEVLFGKLANGGSVKISRPEDRLEFEISARDT